MLKRAKMKAQRSKLKVTARQRSIDFSPYGRRPSVHIQLLATLIENLFLMFLLRYGQDDSSANFDCLWVNCYIVTFFLTAQRVFFALFIYKVLLLP